MSIEEKTKNELISSLTSKESQEKYLEFLDKRIEENRKSLGNLFLILLISALTFILLLQAKVSEINIGPLKITDNKIIFSIIPTIFTFVYYKYLLIWMDISHQKRIYYNLTSLFFEVEKESTLNDKIKHFSLIDSNFKYQESKINDFLGCLINLFWIPVGLFLLFIPFGFEFFLLSNLFQNLNPKNLFEWFLLICPIIISIYTIVMLINAIKKSRE